MPDSAPDVPSETAGDASPAAVPTLPYAAPEGPGWWKTWLMSSAARAVLALILILVIGAIFNANGTFFQYATHRDTMRQLSVFGILACGMTLVIISGGIDLAVGSVLALVAVCFAMFSIHDGMNAWLAIPLSLLIGAATGLVSGALSSWGRIQPFIATLAMMVFARGLAKAITGGPKITQNVERADGTYDYVDIPAIFDLIDNRILGGQISVVTIIFALCALVTWLLLSRHRWGRQLYAVGGNEKAAALSGVPVSRVKTLAYVLSGTFAAVAGICYAAQDKQGDPNVGVAYELTAIAVVVIGGTNLMGGRGGMGLTVLGALTIGYLDKILSINAVGEPGRLMLTGVIVVAAVLTQRQRG